MSLLSEAKGTKTFPKYAMVYVHISGKELKRGVAKLLGAFTTANILEIQKLVDRRLFCIKISLIPPFV